MQLRASGPIEGYVETDKGNISKFAFYPGGADDYGEYREPKLVVDDQEIPRGFVLRNLVIDAVREVLI